MTATFDKALVVYPSILLSLGQSILYITIIPFSLRTFVQSICPSWLLFSSWRNFKMLNHWSFGFRHLKLLQSMHNKLISIKSKIKTLKNNYLCHWLMWVKCGRLLKSIILHLKLQLFLLFSLYIYVYEFKSYDQFYYKTLVHRLSL